MGLTLITAPISDPVSLAEAKSHCRITGADDDGLIAGYILAAREYAEGFTRRAFVTQTWEYAIDDEWPYIYANRRRRFRIELPKPPVQSVTSVKYIDTSGVEQTLTADQYRVANLNQERAEAFIEPAYGIAWPSARRQAETITVRLVCGYGTTANPFPEPIRQALLLLIGHWMENREAVNIGNIVNELPFAVETLLFPYRLFY